MAYNINVSFDVKITANVLADILLTALNGGINYWGNIENYPVAYLVSQVLTGESIKIFDVESDEEWLLDKDKLLSGIKQYLADPDIYEKPLERDEFGELTIDTIQIDAVAADIIIQYALFNEIVFA